MNNITSTNITLYNVTLNNIEMEHSERAIKPIMGFYYIKLHYIKSNKLQKAKKISTTKKCDLQTCEKVVIGALAPFPGIACLADGSKLMMTK